MPSSRGPHRAWIPVSVLLVASAVTTACGAGGGRGAVIVDTRPSMGPQEFLIQRFFTEARDPRAAFTVVMEGRAAVTDAPELDVTMASTVDLHGDDWIGDITVVMGGETLSAAFAEIEGMYFERIEGDDSWARFESEDAGEPMSPFARISTLTEVEYVGTDVTTPGGTLHHLRVAKWLGDGGWDFRMMGLRLGDRENRFDIWVTDDGVPVRAEYASAAEIRAPEGTFEVTASGTYHFSNWDAVDPIEQAEGGPADRPERPPEEVPQELSG